MTTLYATEVTQAFLNRQAAIDASGAGPNPLPPFNFVGGTLAVGDGNGAVPTLSTLLAQNGLTHQVWSGQTITGVNQDGQAANQIDIQCVIPDMVNGVEVGGFTIREFAIWDELGNLCVLGITNIEKTTSQQGQLNTVMFVAAIVVSNTANVVITPPSANFVTMVEVENAFNANLPTAAAPLTQTDTQTPTGWIRRVFGLRPASKPAGGAPFSDALNTGYGRPATDAEFVAGASAGGFAWPWATLAQIKSAIGAIPAIPGALAPLIFDAANNRYGALAATTGAFGVGRVATADEAKSGVTTIGTPAPAFVTPEGLLSAIGAPGVTPPKIYAWGFINASGVMLAGGGATTALGRTGEIVVTMAAPLPDTRFMAPVNVIAPYGNGFFANEVDGSRSVNGFSYDVVWPGVGNSNQVTFFFVMR
jgi:hypothetical protein